MTLLLPILGQFFQGAFSRIWLIIGWQVCILGLLSAKCSYLLKIYFNYIFQVSILSMSRKVMEGNVKLKSSKWNVLRRNKKSQIWTKKTLSEYLDWNLKKLMSYLKSTPSNLSKYQKSSKTTTITAATKNGTKNALFRHFWARILKNYCHIWNTHPQICLIVKFHEKTKLPKFGTKNALFGYFWARILENYCHIWNTHPQSCLMAKFCEKLKMCKFGTENALFGYFWAKMLKHYCHI